MALRQSSPIPETIYDLFVVFDDRDDTAKDTILPELTKHDINYCSLQEHTLPGARAFGSLFGLVTHARRILCIISKCLSKNERYKYMIQSACFEPTMRRKFISLVTDGELTHRNGFSCLRQCPIIKVKGDWVSELKTEMLTIIPEYCILYTRSGASNFILSKGLILQQMDLDLYGVLIKARNKNFVIDLPEFSRHVDKHSRYNVPQVCEDCGYLCDLDTTISLGFTDEFLSNENGKFGDSDLSKGLLELMKSVMDAYNPHSKSNLWSVSCAVNGEYTKPHATYIKDMFGSVVYALLNKAASKMDVPFLPEFADIEQRKETIRNVGEINDEAKIDDIAQAGFVCIAKPDRMQCFQCGWHMPLSVMDIEPMLYHASYMPLCPYIQKTLRKEDFPPVRVHHKKFDNSDLSTDNVEDDFKEFAEAGFYRNGFEQVIECISCGTCIIVNNAKTNPWETHALLAPDCKFLLEKKGEEFVKSVNRIRATDQESTIVTYALTDFSFNHRDEWPGILFTPDTI